MVSMLVSWCLGHVIHDYLSQHKHTVLSSYYLCLHTSKVLHLPLKFMFGLAIQDLLCKYGHWSSSLPHTTPLVPSFPFLALVAVNHGRLLYVFSVCWCTTGPHHHPLWRCILPGMYQGLLGPIGPPGCLQLPRVSGNLHSSSCPAPQRAWRWFSWTSLTFNGVNTLSGPQEGLVVWFLHRPKEPGSQVMPGVSGVLLWDTCQASLWVCHVQAAQAGRWDRASRS